MEKYSLKNNYDFYIFKSDEVFSKFQFITESTESSKVTFYEFEVFKEFFDRTDYEAVFYLDYDVLITNINYSLDKIFDVNEFIFIPLDTMIFNEDKYIKNYFINPVQENLRLQPQDELDQTS